MRKLVLIFSIFSILGLLLPSFSLAPTPKILVGGFAQEINQAPKAPETLEEAGEMGITFLRGLPQALKAPWQEALSIWGKMTNVFSGWWNAYIFPWLKSIWHQITTPFKKEIERRKPIIEEELEKEKIEMKEEIKIETSKAGKSLWQRFKELLK